MNIKSNYLLLLIILIVHGLLLSKLIFFPYPEFFVYPYLMNQGLVPYGQIFDQHFPGLMFLPLNFDNLGMTNEIVARWWLIGTVVLTHILLHLVSLKIFKKHSVALLANLIYLVWQPYLEGWTFWIDSILPLFLLPAFYFSYQAATVKNSKSVVRALILTGLFFSLGVLFKQIVLPLAGVVGLYLLWSRPKISTVLWFSAGFLPLILAVLGYYWWLGVLADAWYWTIVFNLTVFADQGRKPPTLFGLIRIAFIYSPLVWLPILKDKKLITLLLLFLLGSFSGDIARFDFVHFQPSLPFIAMILAASLSYLWSNHLGRVYLLGYVVVAILWLSVFYQGHISKKVFFFDAQTKSIATKIKSYTEPGEEIYILGAAPHLYQMSHTIPTGRIFVFQFPWFLEVSSDRFIQALQQNPPKLVVRDQSVVIEGDPLTRFAADINSYLDQNYQTVETIGTVEFMLKR